MIRATFPEVTGHHGNDFNDFNIAPGEPAIFLNTGVWMHPPFDVVEVPKEAPPVVRKDPFNDKLAYPELNSI